MLGVFKAQLVGDFIQGFVRIKDFLLGHLYELRLNDLECGSKQDGIYLAIQSERREEACRKVLAWLQALKIKSYK